VLNNKSRLVLVNAIHLKAPWEEPFEKVVTSRRPFTRADGSRVQVDMMSNDLRQGEFASGPGWRAARLRYAGRKLGMAVVVPGPGKAPLVQDILSGAGLAQILAAFKPTAALRLDLPRWRFRVQTQLDNQLRALGMSTAFDEKKADLSGMTTEERLRISRVLHEATIAVDEAGTEAAAATAVVVEAVSGGGLPSVVLTADRPFFFIVHDIETAVPLFIGRVSDPARSS